MAEVEKSKLENQKDLGNEEVTPSTLKTIYREIIHDKLSLIHI